MGFWKKEKPPTIDWRITTDAMVEKKVDLDRERLFEDAVDQIVEEKVYRVILADLIRQAGSEFLYEEKQEEAREFIKMIGSKPDTKLYTIEDIMALTAARFPMLKFDIVRGKIRIAPPKPTLEMLALSITKQYMDKEL